VGLTKRSNGMKILKIVDQHRLLPSVNTRAANYHEASQAILP
jgi:hypothetical protein